MSCEKISMSTLIGSNMFYYRMNVHIMQVLSSCESITKVVKKCHSSGENIWEKFFFEAYSWLVNFSSMPNLLTSKYFQRLLTFYPAPPAINNDRSLWTIYHNEHSSPFGVIGESKSSSIIHDHVLEASAVSPWFQRSSLPSLAYHSPGRPWLDPEKIARDSFFGQCFSLRYPKQSKSPIF